MKSREHFTFQAFGHPNILATHLTTIELTREKILSVKGDCVVGVGASCGLSDLPASLKRLFSVDSGRGRVVLTVGTDSVVVEGQGANGLTLLDPKEIVIRKSGFLSDRTMMVHANKSASDLPKAMVDRLRDPSQKILIQVSAWQV